MNWLKEFEDDIILLQEVAFKHFFQDSEQFKTIILESKEIFAPLIDGSIDPGDLDNVAARYWNRFGSSHIACMKEETLVQRRLAKLYERLETATENDWADYAKMRLGVLFKAQHPIWKAVTETFASQRREIKEVVVTPTSLSLAPGSVTQYVASAHDGNGNVIPDRSFEWESSNRAIATVDHKGVVTALCFGVAMITATETVMKLQGVAMVTVC